MSYHEFRSAVFEAITDAVGPDWVWDADVEEQFQDGFARGAPADATAEWIVATILTVSLA